MLWLLACANEDGTGLKDSAEDVARDPTPATTPGRAVLKRLTATQYQNTVHDLLGDEIIVTSDLEPDAASEGLLVIGGTVNALSAAGVEDYEAAAFSNAEQVLANSTLRSALIPCDTEDRACAETVLSTFAPRAWRRPITDAERTQLLGVYDTASSTLGSFDAGMTYALAAVMQSPYFVYRVELGEENPDLPGSLRYTGYEMASRLSYFLWNTTPDDTLLAEAAAGTLVTDEGVEAQLDRMLADPRAKDGIRAFFDDMFGLYALDELTKDPDVYVHYSTEVGPSAREEALQLTSWLVLDQDADYRTLFTTQTTFVDRKLAAIYAVQAPVMDGFGQVELPDSLRRRGFLGSVAFLSMNAHPTSTSPTRRGAFVREVLFCTPLSSPPANVDTSIPAPSGDAPTMRDRLEEHASDPSCAGCHALTDPIGLGFENFDGLAGWRTTENDVTIDTTGDLDGVWFDDAWELSAAIADNARLGNCLAQTMFQYATAHAVATGESDLVRWHSEGFASAGYRVQWLIRDIVAGPGFRHVSEVK